MSVILILLLASISVAAIFLGAFLWSVKAGQYNDEISPPLRILLETPMSPEPPVQQGATKQNNSIHHTQPTTKTTN
jgi:cbb3-type cytochrome oxidase maturation protein